MTLPWDIPPPPVPVVARNPATGEQVRVDVSENLRQAIRDAINGTVMENKAALKESHPVVVKLSQDFTERTLLHGAAIDIAAATAAVLATLAAPDSTLTKAFWIITAVLAAKTLLLAGQTFATGMLEKKP